MVEVGDKSGGLARDREESDEVERVELCMSCSGWSEDVLDCVDCG